MQAVEQSALLPGGPGSLDGLPGEGGGTPVVQV